jgi:hypothetical protein
LLLALVILARAVLATLVLVGLPILVPVVVLTLVLVGLATLVPVGLLMLVRAGAVHAIPIADNAPNIESRTAAIVPSFSFLAIRYSMLACSEQPGCWVGRGFRIDS